MRERRKARALIVDDDEAVRDALESALDEAGYSTVCAPSLAAARLAIAAHGPDVVLLDVRLHDGDGLAFLAELRATTPDLPVIMATAYGDSERTISAMKAGAFDYVTKPFDLPALLAAVARAARAPQPAPRAPSTAEPSTFIGSSPAMLPVWKAIGRAAASDVPVLVTGESGVGKELTARAIHEHGDRRHQPFVAVNVAALPPALLESELFGHERGAFTGASARRLGRFELARQGTIFLDEIGDLEPPLQTKLLRVLEDGSFERVGGEAPVASNARIIAATSRPVKPGTGATLREDLYYRLSVINIRVPPLRERRGDIPLLVDGFLRRRGGSRRAISEAALDRLSEMDWPGNVRQLLHAVENACVMSAADVLDVGDFDLGDDPGADFDEMTESGRQEEFDLRTNLERLERTLIKKSLAKAGGNRAQAARLLGIRRQHLYSRIEALGIEEERS
jgi:DNA-binding NtrC family response regulator